MQVTISDLQAYLAQHYSQHGNETALFMKLVEEIGEVAEILNQRAGRKAHDNSDLDKELSKEIADVIHYAVALAAINKLPLTETILEKDKSAAIKYQHSIDLETFLSKE
ncbi:MazG nucleotide pyrophosphohydrolase domain-containing protein [Streptococcus loxodontisalivarius]|uniref:NTP pyrophosphatase (Non-canonical NTP hydrolase) n=1 Tax=Streptococcus loxodontisalivarius TaxID=1349415 RepID=A0ABS2PP29_9STRE|nr:MazG nucleotide pyrophosphohydrolase domain-containing protein [Streptococcus loxodontisalivarius]MBM7641791.1 NTP pyrophosphatase (non-canonical NTP hydrolase) [Streptococcus loxodontisalivarius]